MAGHTDPRAGGAEADLRSRRVRGVYRSSSEGDWGARFRQRCRSRTSAALLLSLLGFWSDPLSTEVSATFLIQAGLIPRSLRSPIASPFLHQTIEEALPFGASQQLRDRVGRDRDHPNRSSVFHPV